MGGAEARAARIAHPSSVSLFQSRLADRIPDLRRAAAEDMARAGDVKSVEPFVYQLRGAFGDGSRGYERLWVYNEGHPDYLGRLIDFMDSIASCPRLTATSSTWPLDWCRRLRGSKEPDVDVRRLSRRFAVVGGLVDGDIRSGALQKDRSREVATAAKSNAIERIKRAGQDDRSVSQLRDPPARPSTRARPLSRAGSAWPGRDYTPVVLRPPASLSKSKPTSANPSACDACARPDARRAALRPAGHRLRLSRWHALSGQRGRPSRGVAGACLRNVSKPLNC